MITLAPAFRTLRCAFGGCFAYKIAKLFKYNIVKILSPCVRVCVCRLGRKHIPTLQDTHTHKLIIYSHVYAEAAGEREWIRRRNGERCEDAPFDDAPNRMRIITAHTHTRIVRWEGRVYNMEISQRRQTGAT